MASESSMTIPQDLIIEILYRLPAKSLGRFRCVSKDWLSLHSEPKFIKSHINIVSRNHLLFIDSFSFCSLPLINYYPTPLSRPTKVDHLHTHRLYNFHGSCNGLVLVSYVSGELVVFNPTTRDFVRLPKIRKDMFYGFGYDTATDDYKVVAMPCNHDPDYNHVNVYSLRTNAWRQVIKSSYGMYVRSGVLFNGFLHWIATKDIHHLPVIYAFSLADEKFSKLSSPKDDDLISYGDLVALGEKLAIFNGREGEIWLMNEYGVSSSWTKIVFVHAFDRYPVISPMIFYDNGKIMFVNSDRDRMMIYDVEERTFCKSVDISYTILSWAKCIVYVESLVSPKSVRTV